MGKKRTAFFVRRLKKSDFPIPILTSCLWSVIAPKRIDRFWCAWCQLLTFFKLYDTGQEIKNRLRKSQVIGLEGRPIFYFPSVTGCQGRSAIVMVVVTLAMVIVTGGPNTQIQCNIFNPKMPSKQEKKGISSTFCTPPAHAPLPFPCTAPAHALPLPLPLHSPWLWKGIQFLWLFSSRLEPLL